MAAPGIGSSLRRTFGALVVLATTACASVQGRYTAIPLSPAGQRGDTRQTASGLLVSGGELARYSSELFGLIEVTFENPTSEWMHVERLELDFGSPEKNAGVFLPEGADLVAWHEATVRRNDIRNTNAASALGALLALGTVVAVAASAGGKRGLAAAGGAVALGAATTAAMRKHGHRVDRAEQVHLLTETHLLAVPFAIPPGLFAKKWVLINTRSRATPCVPSMVIDYDVERGNERVLLVFRRDRDDSAWQSDSCSADNLRAGRAAPGAPGVKGYAGRNMP